MLGVYSPKHKHCASLKSVLIIYILMEGFVATWTYFSLRADSNRDFENSFYASVTQLLLLIHFIILIVKVTNIHELIVDFEEFIEQSIQTNLSSME